MNLDTLPLEVLSKICTEHGLGGLDLARLDAVNKSIHGRMLGDVSLTEAAARSLMDSTFGWQTTQQLRCQRAQDSYKKLLYEGTDRRAMLASMESNVTAWDVLRQELSWSQANPHSSFCNAREIQMAGMRVTLSLRKA